MRIHKSVVVAGLVLATTVHAADHLMHVDEVLIDGGNGEQFIELHDTATESLPAAPYKLVIYNSGGTMTETVTLTGLTAGPTVYYTVGNAAAATTYNGVTFDATLTLALPNPGQACFERSNNAKVHCLAWGCNTTIVQTQPPTQNSNVPTSGMSLSRNAAIQFATPTPKAANGTGTAAGLACTPMMDAGVSADASGGNSGGDAGTNLGDDDETGCCQSTTTPARSVGAALMSLLVLGFVVRRRRR